MYQLQESRQRNSMNNTFTATNITEEPLHEEFNLQLLDCILFVSVWHKSELEKEKEIAVHDC